MNTQFVYCNYEDSSVEKFYKSIRIKLNVSASLYIQIKEYFIIAIQLENAGKYVY